MGIRNVFVILMIRYARPRTRAHMRTLARISAFQKRYFVACFK